MDTAFYAARSHPRTRVDPRQDMHLRALEDENIRLKLLLAEAVVENADLKARDRRGSREDEARTACRPEDENDSTGVLYRSSEGMIAPA